MASDEVFGNYARRATVTPDRLSQSRLTSTMVADGEHRSLTMKILALDMGRRKSVACVYAERTGEHTNRTIRTSPQELHDLLVEHAADRLVIEIGPAAGWVCDLAGSL